MQTSNKENKEKSQTSINNHHKSLREWVTSHQVLEVPGEGSGRIWQSTQNGNSFQWIQQGTNRMATGTLVSTKVSPTSVSDWAIHITFDGNVHWRLTSSPDGNTLYGMGDNFYRASSSANFSQPSVYNVNGLNHGMVASSIMNQYYLY